MRRLIIFIAILLMLAVPVSAFSGVSDGKSDCAVSSDGSCQVTLSLKLQLSAPVPELKFPLPAQAEDVSINGSPTSAPLSDGVRLVNLSSVITAAGTYDVVLRYRLADVITLDKKQGLTLSIPILSGFAYPIDAFSFSVTLPGDIPVRPSFTSTYYQETVETMLTVTQTGPTIQAVTQQRLQDHETLTMTLPVSEEMFPQPAVKRWSMDTVDLVMIGIGLVALAYWLLFLRCLPMKRQRRTTPPDGITAGEIGCRLTQQGVDFTLMVLSWAQMGYLLIQPDGDGRVLLHKRMDMGNERSEFENKWFRKLFGRRTVVDGTGHYYAQLCRKTRNFSPGLRALFSPRSGNVKLFRMLCCAVGGVSGVSLAAAYADGGGWEVVLAIVLGACGCVASWLIQSMGKAIHGRSRMCILWGVVAAAAWLWLSFGVGEWNVALFIIPVQFLAGLAALYGGRRNQTGRIAAGEILGLRQYMQAMDSEELKRNLSINPQYFYDLAPYALALGLDRHLARQLKKVRLPQCPYLTTGMDGHLTAQEWNDLLRRTVRALDSMQQRLPIEQLLGR